jgi:hypothetical protein
MLAPVRKELRPVHENVACDVCGRTILKGERTEAFLAPGGKRHTVCELCFERAERHGWLRESGSADAPTRASMGRPEQRRSLLGRLRRGPARTPAPRVNGPEPEPEAEEEPQPEPEEAPQNEPTPAHELVRRLRKEARHVRAVPTTAEVKVERALDLFNGSEHQRTIAGLVRTLGPPWVSARADLDTPSAVTVVVAWELSWYRFRIDLGDEEDPVVLAEKGEEVGEIDEELRNWNAGIATDGTLVAELGSERPG